jgi:regulatory protein
MKKRKPVPQQAADASTIEQVALRHLNRFDATVAGMRRVLIAHCRRAGLGEAEASELIEPLLARYRASGLLDDTRYAAAAAHGQRRRGASRRAIEQKLAQRGVSAADARAAVDDIDRETDDAELRAALAFARRRRLGRHRALADRSKFRKKDLAALARAGFDLDTARRALGAGDDDDETF